MVTFYKRRSFFVAALIVLVVAIGIYLIIKGYRYKDSLDGEFTITFSPKWLNQAQFAGVFVAQDKKFYEKRGIKVEVNEFKAGDSVLKDLESGESQLGLMSANEFLINYSKGKPIKALAAFYQISPYIVASLKQSNIESPSEFLGKTLGIKGGVGAEGEVVYDLLLSSVALGAKDVKFEMIPFGTSEKEDLADGKADAIGFYRTRLYQFDKEGLQYDIIYPEQYGAALYNDVLVVTNEFLETHPEEVRRFLEATIEGIEYAFKNKEEAVTITLRNVTDEDYKDIDYERYILNESEALMNPDGRTNIGDMRFEKWERFYNTLFLRGVLENEFEVKNAFTTKYLP